MIAREIERFPVHERGEVQALLDGFAPRQPNSSGDSPFMVLRLLDLADRDLDHLRRLVAIAKRDPRDLAEWRMKRLLLATL